MVPSDQPGRRSSGCYYTDKQPAGATRLRTSRWMPTPQQLMALKEMYQRGITTPTAQQIRLVTAQLRNFGRIEGKNVFYWFQNHRARERQKRRRQLMSMYQSDSKQQQQQQQQQEQVTFNYNTVNGLEDKESAEGVTKSSLEVEQQSLEDEQQNNWKLPNISTVLSDQAASSILQERMMSMEFNSSRKLVEQSGSLRPTSDTKAFRVDTNPLDFHHYYHYDYDAVLTAPIIHMREEERRRETKTLELFPLKSENLKGAKDTKLPICRTTSKDTSADFMAENIISIFERIKAAYN